MTGDVFYITSGAASGDFGHITQYDFATGTLLASIVDPSINGVGGAVHPATREPYWTQFTSPGQLWKANTTLTEIDVVVANTGTADSESVVIRGNEIYVGHADGDARISKYDLTTGSLITTFTGLARSRGTDWISLHPDGKTMYYTTENDSIYRYDLDSSQMLTVFASVPSGVCYTVLVRQSDEHVFVGNETNGVWHFDKNGTVVNHYLCGPTPPYVFGMALDLAETTLIIGDFNSTNVWKVDIATGDGTAAPWFTQPGSRQTGGIFSLGGTQLRSGLNAVRVNFW